MYSLLKSSSPCRAEYLLQYPIRKDIFVISVIFHDYQEHKEIWLGYMCVCVQWPWMRMLFNLPHSPPTPTPNSVLKERRISTARFPYEHGPGAWIWSFYTSVFAWTYTCTAEQLCVDLSELQNSSPKGLWQTFMCKNWVALWTETGYPGAPVLLLLWYPGKPAFCLHPLSRPS